MKTCILEEVEFRISRNSSSAGCKFIVGLVSVCCAIKIGIYEKCESS